MRCITAIDENVGRIMTALNRLELADDTVVVLAGDNGFYLREHAWLINAQPPTTKACEFPCS